MAIKCPICPNPAPKPQSGKNYKVHARVKWEPKPVVVRPTTPITFPEYNAEADKVIAVLVKEMQDTYCKYENLVKKLADLQGQVGNPREQQIPFAFAVKMIIE